MHKTVFLNAAKINFDGNLNFSPLESITEITLFDHSNHDEILERVKGHQVVITKELPLPGELLRQFLPDVKLICEAGTGFNNIDIAAATEKGITVCNVPGYSTEAVAQLAITFMLNFCSSLIQQQYMIKDGNLSNFSKHLQVPHVEMQNKTLGILGAGSIGRQVIKIARAFGMNVLTYSRTPKRWDDPAVQSVSLEELLQQSDFVSIHSPLTTETKYLIDRSKLKLMKPTAFLINTARGAIIKEEDLIPALQNGEIAGAALDVQDPEPPRPDNPLFTMDNVILTPHIGWQTIESRQRLVNLLAQNINAFKQGKPLNTVN
ncbi:NAD(P)-dependent oxidoreductase [Dethiobacter alkaliphilus]|uniref:D-isomer specific 2-hydroxyacid dehydrogenase NAD-binding n=1 Tax=Dethiobacter alkaliphilus AHT 1 TaxID=555088 RepID=C0GHE4_DETAL|nr:NAD(P)-dependent oxidoreductase [Dethiobacter alkaliphilus]EEG77150.1 D-isomer specific 2-hydroxyacid dehydrogenase NAD-binding [Dethiobacter alkaliphilus AHT 1]